MENYYLKKKKKIRYNELFITTLLTHGGSNIISKWIVSPFERVIIIRQIQPVLFRNILITPFFSYSNIIKSIYRNQSLTSFWWGYNASVLNFLSFTFFRLLFYDQIKYNLFTKINNSPYYETDNAQNRDIINNSSSNSSNNDHAKNSIKNSFLMNFFLLYSSSCLAATITYPLDTIRNCMALVHETQKSKKHNKRSIFLFVYDLLLKNKLTILYSGYSLCLLNFIPYLFITIKLTDFFTKHFIEFDLDKNKYNSLNNKSTYNSMTKEYEKLFNNINITSSFFSYIFWGVLTGYVAQAVTYPLETMRRKYQYHLMFKQNFPKSVIHYNKLYKNETKNVMKKFVNLYRGFSLHTFKLIPEYLIFTYFFYYVKSHMPL
ncbi:ADP/ATP carrier protein, putative [Hepatocystis sp. ex Piliocolobus tephrosceles]|nr:ADP/ATP carrier protein, putative [Hepatocystis sp. ex Piliocolobus tephrosceles]